MSLFFNLPQLTDGGGTFIGTKCKNLKCIDISECYSLTDAGVRDIIQVGILKYFLSLLFVITFSGWKRLGLAGQWTGLGGWVDRRGWVDRLMEGWGWEGG